LRHTCYTTDTVIVAGHSWKSPYKLKARMSLYRSTGIQDIAHQHTLNFDHSENRTH